MLSSSVLFSFPPLIKEIEMAAIFIAREERNSGSAATGRPQGVRANRREVPFLAGRTGGSLGIPVVLSEGVKMGC